MFQQEMRGIYKLIRKEESREGSTTIYSFTSVNEDNNKKHQVVYEEAKSISAKCSCALFETTGLLCRHILNVMCNMHQLQAIPDSYVLCWWRTDARHRSMNDLILRNYRCNEGNMLKAKATRATFNEAWQMSLDSNELIEELYGMLSSFIARHEVAAKQKSNASHDASHTMTQDLAAHVTIRDPSGPASTKGRPREAARLKSGLKKATAKEKKKQRTCQNCFQKGHYRTSCKNPPASSLPYTQEWEDDDDDNGTDLATPV